MLDAFQDQAWIRLLLHSFTGKPTGGLGQNPVADMKTRTLLSNHGLVKLQLLKAFSFYDFFLFLFFSTPSPFFK